MSGLRPWLAFFKREKTIAVLIVLGMVLLGGVLQFYTTSYMEQTADKVFQRINSADQLQQTLSLSLMPPSSPRQKVLRNQYQLCQQYKEYKKKLIIIYYTNYYSFSICAIFFTTLLSIAVKANQGWQNTNRILRAFLLSALIGSSTSCQTS